MHYPLNINEPDRETQSTIADVCDKYDSRLTLRKGFIRIVLIALAALVALVTLYCGLFVIEFEKVPSKSISVGDVTILYDNLLSFHLTSADYSLTGSCDYEINQDGIVYFSVYKPILQNEILRMQRRTELFSGKYDIDVRGVSAVYYIGYNSDDKVLIWENEMSKTSAEVSQSPTCLP